jgi:hypothetical protein
MFIMEEKNLKRIKWIVIGLFLFAFIAGSVYVLSSNNSLGKSSAQIPDPETGIQMWMKAMNLKYVDRVYDLAPDEIKEQRTLDQYKEDNLNSTFLLPDTSFTSYTVIDKKQNGTYAEIDAQVIMQLPGKQGNPSPEVPLYYKFDLFYEHGEWKVWVDAETGIQMWIEAFNARNIDRVYDLAPDEIKSVVTLAQYKEDNLNNTLLQPGYSFVNYGVINKKQNATYSEIIAQLFMQQPGKQGNPGPEVPIQYKFGLYYEHGEWKIWMLNFS